MNELLVHTSSRPIFYLTWLLKWPKCSGFPINVTNIKAMKVLKNEKTKIDEAKKEIFVVLPEL